MNTNSNVISPARSIDGISGIQSNDNTIVNMHDNLNFSKQSPSTTQAFARIPEGNENGVDIATFMENRHKKKSGHDGNSRQQRRQQNWTMNASKSHKEYTLNGWKEYAADKYGNMKFFQESPTGKKCIETAAVAHCKADMLALKKWADNVEESATLLLDAFEQERSLVAAMRKKIASLETRLQASDPVSYGQYCDEYYPHGRSAGNSNNSSPSKNSSQRSRSGTPNQTRPRNTSTIAGSEYTGGDYRNTPPLGLDRKKPGSWNRPSSDIGVASVALDQQGYVSHGARAAAQYEGRSSPTGSVVTDMTTSKSSSSGGTGKKKSGVKSALKFIFRGGKRDKESPDMSPSASHGHDGADEHSMYHHNDVHNQSYSDTHSGHDGEFVASLPSELEARSHAKSQPPVSLAISLNEDDDY